MTMIKTQAVVALAASVLLSGCGTFYKPTAIATVPCEGQQCNDMWAKAQTWLVTHGRYRIQTVNDHVIQTFGPHENVYDGVAFTLTREKAPDGKTVIQIIGNCAPTVYGCVFSPAPFTNELFEELKKL
jgi:uncharacterized protein YceK